MHDTTAQGNEYFKCDFCRKPWAEERPMVEGHRGSLICADCLTVAYTQVFLASAGTPRPEGAVCTLCLEPRDAMYWTSPLYEEARVCKRCINQAAVTLERDPDHPWKRPSP